MFPCRKFLFCSLYFLSKIWVKDTWVNAPEDDWHDDRWVRIRKSAGSDEQRSMKGKFELMVRVCPALSIWLTPTHSIFLFRGVFVSLHLSLTPFSLPLSSPSSPFSTTAGITLSPLVYYNLSSSSAPALYLTLPFFHPPSSPLSISPSSTLSLFIQRNAVCGRLWLFGCWYLRLCSGVSDFHWCFEWCCARTSVCVYRMCCIAILYVLVHVLCHHRALCS